MYWPSQVIVAASESPVTVHVSVAVSPFFTSLLVTDTSAGGKAWARATINILK